MYAIFLLALLADVARVHALTPVEADAAGSLILSAANQLHGGQSGGAVIALRRAEGSAQKSRLECLASRFSGWSKHLADLSYPAMAATVAWALDAGAGFSPVSPFRAASLALAIFPHTGSPAP